jgi:hypothetical protein
VQHHLGLDARIEPGRRSEFTVWSDGELVFSKEDELRFPEPDEIVARLRSEDRR